MITIAFKSLLLILFSASTLYAQNAQKPAEEVPSEAKEVQKTEVPQVKRVCATLFFLKNRVWVHRKITKDKETQWVAFKPKRGEKIGCKDRVETASKSRAIVRGKNFKVVMAPNTRIDINRLRSKKDKKKTRSLIDLTYGKLRSFVKEEDKKKKDKTKNPSNSSFRIKTKVAVVGVRGTDFYTSFSPATGKAEQAAVKGEILVERSKDKKVVSVKSGEQVVVRDEAPVKIPQSKKAGQIPTATPVALPELTVEKIKPAVVKRIQATSSIVKDNKEVLDETKEFQSEEALKILGKVDTWVAPKETLPEDLDNIKNEF